MAKEPEEKKDESKVALEGLQSSLDEFSQKLDTSINDVNTRLDGFQTKIDDFKPLETPTYAPQTEEYVPKGWNVSTEGGWNDVFRESAKIAKEQAATAASTAINAYKDEVATKEQEKQAETDKWNKQWNNQLVDLEKQGKIPKVENPDNDKDPGVVARQELFQLGVDYESTNLTKMANLRDSIKKVPPKGAEAPVGSSSRTTSPSKSVDYEKDIKNKSMDQMVEEDFPR
jgi:hypothetical protein